MLSGLCFPESLGECVCASVSCCKVLYHFLYLVEQILEKSCWDDYYYMSGLMSLMNKVYRWIVLTIKCRLGFAEEKLFMIYV